jgi:hypothetical protein
LALAFGVIQEKANFIGTVADDVFCGSFKAHEYGDVIRLKDASPGHQDHALHAHRGELFRKAPRSWENHRQSLS